MKKLLLFAIVLVMFNACGPSLEKETKAWDKNQQKLSELMSQYPAYKQLLAAKKEEAAKLWDEAKNISNEEVKVKKMVEANNVIEQGTVGKLAGLKREKENLLEQKNKVEELLVKYPEYNTQAREPLYDVRDATRLVDEVLYAKGELSIGDAEMNINRASDKLSTIKRSLDNVKSAIDKEVKKQQDAAAKTTEQAGKDSTKQETTAAKEKHCEYCDKYNEPIATECKYCGAPLKAKE